MPKVESQLASLLPSLSQSSTVSLHLSIANVPYCLASLRSRHDYRSTALRIGTAGNHHWNGVRRSYISGLNMGIDNWCGHRQTTGHCPNRGCAAWLRCRSRLAAHGLRRWFATTYRLRCWFATHRFRRWFTTHRLRCWFTADRFRLRCTTFCRFLAKESFQKSSCMSFARHGSSQACNQSNTTNFPQSHVRLQTNYLTDETNYALDRIGKCRANSDNCMAITFQPAKGFPDFGSTASRRLDAATASSRFFSAQFFQAFSSLEA